MTATSQSTSGPFKVTHFAKQAVACTTCGATIAAGEKFYRYTETGGRLYGDRFVRRECATCLEKRNELWLRVDSERKALADAQAERTSATNSEALS